MVARARRRLDDARDRLLCGDIGSLPFAEGSFDLVVATGSLEYADPRRAVPELARVLRVGGTAIVSYPNPRALYGIWKSRVVYRSVSAFRTARRSSRPRPQGAGAIRPEGFAELLAVAGFEPPDISYTSYLLVPSPLDLFVPRIAEAAGRTLERAGRFAPLLATQVVYRARKIG
jgi:SAM-dependent methyltransferase